MFRVDRRRLILFLSACWVLGLVTTVFTAWVLASLRTEDVRRDFDFLEWRSDRGAELGRHRLEEFRGLGKRAVLSVREYPVWRPEAYRDQRPHWSPVPFPAPPGSEMVAEYAFGWPLAALGCSLNLTYNRCRAPEDFVTGGTPVVGFLPGFLFQAPPPFINEDTDIFYDTIDDVCYLPWRPRVAGLAGNSVLWALPWLLCLSTWTGLIWLRTRRRRIRRRCVRCRYQLHDSVADRCSECGWVQSNRLPWPTRPMVIGAVLPLPLLVAGLAWFAWWQVSPMPEVPALHLAAARNDVAELERLIAEGADIRMEIWQQTFDMPYDMPFVDWEEPLVWAVANDARDAVHLLLDHLESSEPDRVSRIAGDAIVQAILCDHLGLVKELFGRGYGVDSLTSRAEFFDSPFYDAADLGTAETFAYMLGYLDCGDLDYYGVASSVASFAAKRNETEIIRFVLEKCPELATPELFDSALDDAIYSCSGTQIARWALENGADPNRDRGDRYLPLTMALSEGCMDVMRILLEFGADPSPQGVTDITPLELAELWAAESNWPEEAAQYRAMADLMRQYLDEDDDR